MLLLANFNGFLICKSSLAATGLFGGFYLASSEPEVAYHWVWLEQVITGVDHATARGRCDDVLDGADLAAVTSQAMHDRIDPLL